VGIDVRSELLVRRRGWVVVKTQRFGGRPSVFTCGEAWDGGRKTEEAF